MITVNSTDLLEYGYQYKAKLYVPDIPIYRVDLWGWRCKVEYQLRLSGVLCDWEESEEPNTVCMYYQVFREADITHGEVFEWIMFVYDRVSCLSRVQLGYDPEAIPEYIRAWTGLFASLKFILAYWYVGVIILLVILFIPLLGGFKKVK